MDGSTLGTLLLIGGFIAMHYFMHRGHGNHGTHARHAAEDGQHEPASNKKSGGCH